MRGVIRAILRNLPRATILGLLLGGAAQAQVVDCGRLQAQIASVGRGDPGAAARYGSALARQQAELDRTTNYGRSIGCGNQQFLFFGSAPPPQCGAIDAQVLRMRANVAQLQAQAQRAGGEGPRRDLVAQFDAYCRQQPHGFFDTLFGGAERTQTPIEDSPLATPDAGDGMARGGSKAVCVRSCDGGFFPVSYSARRASLGELDDLCKALCPGTQASLYTYAPGGEIDQAVSMTGEPYSALPNAGRFRTKADPTCACKPANQSWVDALAAAEQMLGREQRTSGPLTQAEADQLSRPQPAKAVSAGAKGRKGAPDPTTTATIDAGDANPIVPPPVSDSAHIAGPGNGADARTFGLGDGIVRTDKGPDGAARRVRTVGPSL